MNVLILGQGGREHALAYIISKSKLVNKLFVAKGNAGIKQYATIVDVNPLDNEAIMKFSLLYEIDLIIPGSELYLQNGIEIILSPALANLPKELQDEIAGGLKKTEEDILEEVNKQVVEYKKSIEKEMINVEEKKKQIREDNKEIMKKYDIPTAEYQIFDNYNEAIKYLDTKEIPIVIKYDGLAAGKGVVVATTKDEAVIALKMMLEDKKYGDGSVIIEEFLEGEEFSLMAFVHDEIVIPMPIAQDHKRLLNNDLGPNTGGMGVYCPVPIISQESVDYAVENVMKKVAKGLVKENCNFTGFLYGGLIQTVDGPKVIEFNARFGDPEAEVILPKLKTDFLEIINNLLHSCVKKIEWDNDYYLGVVLASKGYPNKYIINHKILGINKTDSPVFHMGTKIDKNELLSSGGRVLLVTGKGKTIEEAKENAYINVSNIECDNLIYRTDIGAKSIKK